MKAFSTCYAIKVYANTDGDIIVEQDFELDDENPFIVIPRERLESVITTMRAVAEGETE